MEKALSSQFQSFVHVGGERRCPLEEFLSVSECRRALVSSHQSSSTLEVIDLCYFFLLLFLHLCFSALLLLNYIL